MTAWLPRTTREKLILIDTVLADIVPRYTATRTRITDTMPGHSGRPAGNGDPGGGTSSSTTTVVERTALATPSPERHALAELDRLTESIVVRVGGIVGMAGLRLLPPAPGNVRRLVWARWAVRVLEQTDPRIPNRHIDALWHDVDALDGICNQWGPPRRITQRRTDLANDDTDTWCRSHLRIGSREPRSPHYTNDGLCNTCGRFLGEQGWLPTLDILDALTSGAHGSTIAKLIRAEHARLRPVKRRKGKR